MDLTDLPQNKLKAYNGANGTKKCVIINGIEYMVKFPQKTKRNHNMSYSNGVISEHIGSWLFSYLGMNAQETLIGTYQLGGKEKIVVACKDFESKGLKFRDFASLKNQIVTSDHNGYGMELDPIMETIEQQEWVNPTELVKYFWKMFVIDALLGNFDRHNGNWGFLINEEQETVVIAPVFDCGSCLLPQADEEIMERILADKDELLSRVKIFPQSAIKINGVKINYLECLEKTESPIIHESVLEVLDRYDQREIDAFISNIPYISLLEKEFYSYYLKKRKEIILEQPTLLRKRGGLK